MKTSDIKAHCPSGNYPMNNDDEQTVNHGLCVSRSSACWQAGVHGMFPLGTNGRAYALSFKEKEEILATVIDQVRAASPDYTQAPAATTPGPSA